MRLSAENRYLFIHCYNSNLINKGKEDTERIEEKIKEIQRLKRTNNKLQKENVDLKREKRNAGKPEVEVSTKGPKLRPRNTMYIPSTQKLAFNKKLKQAKDSSLLDAVEHDENKLDEIENDIFTKITESVDKIFKLPSLDARSTFSGYKMLTPDLDLTKDRPRTQTINEGTRERRHSIEERFQEIAEADEEEEKETRKGTMYVFGFKSLLGLLLT